MREVINKGKILCFHSWHRETYVHERECEWMAVITHTKTCGKCNRKIEEMILIY